MSEVYFNLASGPLQQDWSNINLITASDDWSGVPSIEGFLGQDIVTTMGANPGAALTDSTPANDLSVLANLTNPGFLSNGDVGEFRLERYGPGIFAGWSYLRGEQRNYNLWVLIR